MTLENPKKAPTHTETVETLRHLVRQLAGQRLPSERELAIRLGVSRPRLRSGLAILQREGLVEPRQGSGTYAVDLSGVRLRRVVLLIDENLKLADDPFFSRLVELLQANLQAEGVRCLIERIQESDTPSHLEDGVLTLGLAGRSIIERRRPTDPPMVGLLLDAGTQPGRRASVFQLEDHEAGREAARALLRAGCRDILFLGRRNIPASRDRFLGAEEVVMAAGAFLQFVSAHLNYADGLNLGREMALPTGDGPLGIITTNDWLAVGLQTGLHRRELPVPRPIKIVSFDGLPVTADPSVGIDSLAVPIADIARDAVAELRRLHQSAGSTGRIIRYPLHWTSHSQSDLG